MRRIVQFVILVAAAIWAARAAAEMAYYDMPLEDLELTEGSLPKPAGQPNWRNWEIGRHLRPYAVLDGKGEVYVIYHRADRGYSYVPDSGEQDEIALCAPKGREVTGRLFLPKPDWSGYQTAKFRIPASKAKQDVKWKFLRLKIHHYENLSNADIPGGAWFRHQVRQAQKARGERPAEPGERSPPSTGWNRFGEIDATYDLFTGGRAISENLQLDRLLPFSQAGEETVPIDSIEGITVQEIDWKPLLKDLDPKLDPLAGKVPADQHVIFFPSFNAAMAMSDETQEIGGLIFDMADTHSADARTLSRYQKQLCLTVSEMGRLLGPKVIKSMAITGSDPYFPTGTDIAVLFEGKQPAVLEQLILAQVNMKVQAHNSPLLPGEGQGVRADLPKTSPHPNPLPKGEGKSFAKPIHGEIAGISYQGFRAPDRSICSYVARIDGVVVVTNSPYQIKRLAGVAEGKAESIADLDEYKFFRSRYPLGDKGETAFLFLSDATIRRWCGPRWRIATSRRARDAAVMADIQAGQLDRLVRGKIKPGPIYSDLPIAEKGELRLTSGGVESSALGTLDYMTPIGEIPMDRVTKTEAQAYERWRDGYQGNWRWAFDPIALRLGVDHKRLSADLTVMPLIWNTNYREIVEVSRGADFPPDAADPHGALAQIILAVNKDSDRIRSLGNFLHNKVLRDEPEINLLGWLGNHVSIYLDDDPLWEELAKIKPEEREKFLEKNAWRLPIALQADVSNGLKLTAFLAGLRSYVEQTSPGMTHWESLTYKDQPYVKISPTRRALGRHKDMEKLAVCYTASGDALLVTLSEPLLKRSIDRQLDRDKAEEDGQTPPKANHPWLGESLGFQAQRKFLECAAALLRQEYQRHMQDRSWSNLPILNEWKRRYPNEDPVKLHAKFWQTELVCPGGGKYVWNEQWQTMESTVYGHPGEPKEGPAAPPLLQSLERGDFGLTFEEQGLRAKVILTR